MKKHYLLHTLFTLLMFSSCQKDEFTYPVAVKMEIAIAEGNASHLNFTHGYILFDQITFEGQRRQGEDVYFATRSDDEIGPVYFQYGDKVRVKDFDIPQGIYSSMRWRFELEDMDDIGDDTDSSNYDEVDENLLDEGGLLLVGSYRALDGTVLPLYIVVDDGELLVADTKGGDSYGDITLSTENTYNACLVLDPYYALQAVAPESLEAAERSDNDGVEYIEISEDENEALFEIILYRLQNSISVVIE
ncbi:MULTISPECIES: hypothetical protein [unclassified Carboxylicivirga]|uniref:hypothetical protein n=1 Tax=Carboxylicivirga TaxID=1628153 RepID=UPI003D32FD77